jgi:hypothetical protein
MANRYQITFVHPNEDWTWINRQAADFHQAMLMAFDELPAGARVLRIEVEPEGKSFGPLSVHERAHFAGGVMPVGGKK